MDQEKLNRELGDQPEALVRWACGLGRQAVATTSFGPFAAVILHLLTRVDPAMPILWMDSGYATPATYRFADEIRRRLNLDLHIYHPLRSRAHREAVDGGVPAIDDPRHAAFTREVKLEPFERAVRDWRPGVWFTAIRSEETEHRATLAPITRLEGEPEGDMLKIAPVFHWSARQMNDYLKKHDLPNNFDYFDPTKGDDKRECGLHVAH